MLRRSAAFLIVLAIHVCVLAPMAQAQSMIPATPVGGGTSSLVGSIEIKTQNGARVIRGVRHVRHYRRGTGRKQVRRYYMVRRHRASGHASTHVNPNRTRVGNKVLTRPATAGKSDPAASIEIPKAKVENLIIHGVNNLQPGKRYIEVVEQDGKYVIKESGEIDPNGLFLEVVEEDGVWKIKGTDIIIDYDKTFDVSHIPEGVRKYINPETDSIPPNGNYVQYIDDPDHPVIPLGPDTVPITGPGEYVEMHDVPTSPGDLGPSWVSSDVDTGNIASGGVPVEGVPGLGTPVGGPVEYTTGPGVGVPGGPVEYTTGPGVGVPGGPVEYTTGPGFGVPGGPIGGPGIGVPGIGLPGGPVGGPGVGAPGIGAPGAPVAVPAPPVAAVPPAEAAPIPAPPIVVPPAAPGVVDPPAPGVIAPGVPMGGGAPAVGALPLPLKSGHSWGFPGLGLLGPLAAIGALGGLAAIGLASGGGGGGGGTYYYGIPGSTPGPIVAPPVTYPPTPPTPPVTPPCPPTPPCPQPPCPQPPCPQPPPVCHPNPPCPQPPVCPPPPCNPQPPICHPPQPPCPPVYPPCNPYPPTCYPPVTTCPPINPCNPPYNPCNPPPGCGNGYQQNWQQQHRTVGQGCGRPGDGYRQQWWSLHGRSYSNGACQPGSGSGYGGYGSDCPPVADCPPPVTDCPPDLGLGAD